MEETEEYVTNIAQIQPFRLKIKSLIEFLFFLFLDSVDLKNPWWQ